MLAVGCEGEKRVRSELAVDTPKLQSITFARILGRSRLCVTVTLPAVPGTAAKSTAADPRQRNALAPPCVRDSFSTALGVDFNSFLFAKCFCHGSSLEERESFFFFPSKIETATRQLTKLESGIVPILHDRIASLSAVEKRDRIIRECCFWLSVTGRCPTDNQNSSSQIYLFLKKFIYKIQFEAYFDMIV